MLPNESRGYINWFIYRQTQTMFILIGVSDYLRLIRQLPLAAVAMWKPELCLHA